MYYSVYICIKFIIYLFYQISFSYTLGFILTNWAFSLVAPAFAETIKSSEPISTVAIGLAFLKEDISLRTYLTLVPICVGIALSCYHDNTFNMIGFILAAASNIGFSTRAVLSKKLNIQYPDSLDDINLFYQISLKGLLLLVPTAIFFEGKLFWRRVTLPEPNQTSGFSLITEIIPILVLNGMMFATYNLASYIVLRKTDLITHSVLNAFRRVFIILFTTYYFKATLSVYNLFGIAIAITGVIFFGYFKSVDTNKRATN